MKLHIDVNKLHLFHIDFFFFIKRLCNYDIVVLISETGVVESVVFALYTFYDIIHRKNDNYKYFSKNYC